MEYVAGLRRGHVSTPETRVATVRALRAVYDLVGFAARLFAVQRQHGFYADPRFVFPILSLIVLEGTLRETCPEIAFQTEALPFVLRGLMR